MRQKAFPALFSFMLFCSVVQAQFNVAPIIVSQRPISTPENTPVSIAFSSLNVLDLDDTYPDGFTMTLQPGDNYTVSGQIVTPAANFRGRLTVPVTVNDGEDNSNEFPLRVNVTEIDNVEPVITGYRTLTTVMNQPITLTLADLTVVDPDNTYPDDFTLRVFNGSNYSRDETVVTPDNNFVGTLSVRVRVDDGEDESEDFNVSITVTSPDNVRPTINGQAPLATTVATPLTVRFEDLTVTDPDNTYPTGFTMTLYDGTNYTVSGRTITPAANFTGDLSVPVSVNDGEDESDKFNLTVNVNPPPNAKPVITAQADLSTFIATPITLRLADFKVDDSDNTYPDGFTLKVYPGTGYSFSGTTITPNLLFVGTLTVPVTVHDGHTESDRFDTKIVVTLVPNAVPVITGQEELQVIAGTPIRIDLSNLKVTDADNTYPNDFTLTVYDGANYTRDQTTVTPDAAFRGDLVVPVSVNDGKSESAQYDLRIRVTAPANVPPVINGQSTVSVDEDHPIEITLAMLKVTDTDNPGYPAGFTLRVLPPPSNANYTATGPMVTPAQDFDGTLSVPVVVNDGESDSAPYPLSIKVNPINDPPVLTGQKVLSTYVGTAITVLISDLTIKDPDNEPGDLTLQVRNGSNYTHDGNTVTPNSDFRGELKVNITISDGLASVNTQITIRVIDAPNVAPVIEGQDPNPFLAVRNTPLVIELTKLKVSDPDNKFPADFSLTVRPGANYTVSGVTITPANNFIGMLEVPVTVSDGTDNSPVFIVNVNVVAPSARPQIIGQEALVIDEDESISIKLTDLIVTDADDEYPIGFKLDILNGSGYTFSGTTVTPARNLNGFLIVSVKVTDDDGKSSDPYGLTILINPVDDAPVITQFETNPLSYEPGAEAIAITTVFDVEDVDNDNLSFAEVGIQSNTYKKGYDELLFTNTAAIRGVFDADSGKLSLIGYAPLAEYREAIRSIRYHYKLSAVEAGQPEPLPGNRVIYVMVHDGQLPSERRTRGITMETKVDIQIPSAFSPNDDTVNETWQVIALSNPQQCENAVVRVFNKQGQLLFHSVGIEEQWDGKYNGDLLPPDTYYYTVDLRLSYTERTYRGTVVLLR